MTPGLPRTTPPGVTDAATLAETVRAALDCGVPLRDKQDRIARRNKADAALAELEARVAELEDALRYYTGRGP